MVKGWGQRGEVKWSRDRVREMVKGWGQRGEMKWSRGGVRGER